MIKSAVSVLSGNAGASLLLLLRNLIIARMIPVEDYGIAATFAVAMAVVEMASAFGLQQQIVQSSDGDDPDFQAGLQGFQLLRGILSSIVLFLMAHPLAQLLEIPQVVWAYQILALVPFLKSLQHLDIHRKTRHRQFRPLLMTHGLSSLIAVLALAPLYLWFDDWQIMLWSLLIQAAVATLVTHYYADHRWKATINPAIWKQAFTFGWPLLINAILMFCIFQGDRLIVAREMGMVSLAIFAMGLTLTLNPSMVLSKSAQNLLLPKLSTLKDNHVKFTDASMMGMQATTFLAVGFVISVVLLGPLLVPLLLGEKYNALTGVMLWFGLSQGVRLMRNGPAIVALAAGRTTVGMLANIPRIAVLPVAWWWAHQGGSLSDILLLACLGESLSLLVSCALLYSYKIIPASSRSWSRIGIAWLFSCIFVAVQPIVAATPVLNCVLAMGFLGICVKLMPETLHSIQSAYARR
ncbi:oligosaccharide flippase family protein [Epibacterium sp. SM1969]|uniref:Oligosaccharide flippase family protein n=1 Tax=Tritonibacter aquimaris TaxID=2663379 RepID=A0A844B413_9RHOB|nr:oligosaccharide flippase family protein [Tritonibacter aquimaris]MQY44116.1 oligosaccharide flippase family protein [Tritonibacter aquimaris]